MKNAGRKKGKAARKRGVDFPAVRKIALGLPGVEEGTSYGTPAFRLRKKLLARLWEDGETLVLRSDPDDRDALIESRGDAFFVTDHYRGHPYVLVRLQEVDAALFAERFEEAWRRVATKRQIAEYEARR